MKMCDSAIADMKNIGGPHGGALTAGLILQQFVGDGIPWAHLDIAGPAFTDVEDGEWSKGGTGFGGASAGGSRLELPEALLTAPAGKRRIAAP